MSLHCAFLFPQKKFELTFMSTIGYISDNVFFRLNLATGHTEIQHNPHGRSYQAFTASHKRGLIALADYGKNPTISFEYQHTKEKSFVAKDICMLQINMMALSLDIHYLLICCGIPEKSLIIYDMQRKRVLHGENSAVKIGDRQVRKMQFNPGNNRVFAVMFDKCIQIYEFRDSFKIQGSHSDVQQLEEIVIIKKIMEIPCNASKFETFIWDEINNLYISDGTNVFTYSTDTQSEVISYDLEGDFDDNQHVICNFILTKKHLILVYTNGRIEWLNKYYPDLMDEEDFMSKPFYMDKFHEFEGTAKNTKVRHAIYDHEYQKILVAHENGFFNVLDRPAESNEIDEDEQENNKRKEERAGNSEISKKISIECTKFGPYHVNRVVFCRQITGSALLMTISNTGRVVLWSTTQKTALTYSDVGSNVISADTNADFTVLAVSKKEGIVQFYSIADLQNIFLFKQFKLVKNEGQIDQVAFSTTSDELACLSSTNKRLFYILTKSNIEFQVIGYVKIPFTPVSMCWNKSSKSSIKPKYENIFVCVGFGIISVNSPSPISEKRRGNDLVLNCEMHALRTDLQQKLINVLPSGEIITTGKDKFIKKYKQPDEAISKFNIESKSPIPNPLEEIEAHDLEIVHIEINGNKFISCGNDGTVQIRNTQNLGNFSKIAVQGWKNANLSACAFSNQEGLFFTCGKDGIVSMWKNKQIQIKSSDELLKRTTIAKKIQQAGSHLKFYEEVIEQDYLEKMKDSITKKKKVQIQKILQIKTQLKRLLAENESHEDLQKLDRDQFVIDLETRELATKKMVSNCEQIKKESTKKILYNEVYKKKLQELTWDQMVEHLRGINGLKNNFLVYNYQIRKIRKAEKRTLQFVLDLRRNQVKELKSRKGNEILDPDFYKNKNVINGGILQPLILTIFEKKDDKKEEKGKKKKEEENTEKQPEDLEEIPKEEDWQLLYSSFELFSDNSKKNQMIMMQNLIIKIKEAFNKQFNKLLKLRQGQNELINDKNKRIIEICDQLKKSHQIIISNKNILENPETVLQVKDSDIPFARYLSREERQKLEKERIKEEQRLRLLAEDDSSQRALVQMMGGTLEQKKASLFEAAIEREKWMDKPLEDMSDDEKAKLKQFEAKKQKADEQKERIIKKLEAELRKLKQEIDEVMEKYDEKLFNLVRRRIEYDLRIQEQELYCLKLNLSMVNEKQETKKYHILKNKIAQYEAKALDLENYLRQFEKQYQCVVEDSIKSAKVHEPKTSSENEPKIKTIQKTVFDEYQTNVKKKREIEEKLLETNKLAQYQINILDPMKDIESRILAQQNSRSFKFFIPEIKNLQQTFDFPDSLLPILQIRFNHKLNNAEYEQKLKGIKETIMQIQQDIGIEEKKEEKDQIELQNIQNYLEKSKSDLQIQCRIKQGQVEIDNNTPVPKLNDALLISKAAIDQKNANILEKAGLKIDVIKEIKSCRIQVTEETLNLERKQSLIDELSSMIKEVQMLKVKKQMQTALAKKDTKINENQMKSLKEQIEKVRKEGEKRISLFDKKIEKVSQEIDSIKKQNKQLQVQKWNLENTVKQRQKIKQMMVGQNGGGNQEAAQKFQQISINRKLFDKAKQQTEEIELLREELSKLKAKTFANFSSVQR